MRHLAELGDYNNEEMAEDYLESFVVAQNQPAELCRKMADLHKVMVMLSNILGKHYFESTIWSFLENSAQQMLPHLFLLGCHNL